MKVVKYLVLTVAGIILFRLGSDAAYASRGYYAVGGEVFLLLLPVIWYLVETTVRDVIRAWKERFWHDEFR